MNNTLNIEIKGSIVPIENKFHCDMQVLVSFKDYPPQVYKSFRTKEAFNTQSEAMEFLKTEAVRISDQLKALPGFEKAVFGEMETK